MATKAEKFRAQTERRASKTKKPSSKHPRTGSRAARAAMVERSDGTTAGVPHNAAPRASRNSAYVIETSRTGRPPRKSTRKSPTHFKGDSGLRGRAMRAAASPETRTTRRARRPR